MYKISTERTENFKIVVRDIKDDLNKGRKSYAFQWHNLILYYKSINSFTWLINLIKPQQKSFLGIFEEHGNNLL